MKSEFVVGSPDNGDTKPLNSRMFQDWAIADRFVQFKLPYYVKQVSCGSHHVALLDDTGKLFTFGCEENGRLGYSLEEVGILPERRFQFSISLVVPEPNQHGVQEKFIQIC